MAKAGKPKGNRAKSRKTQKSRLSSEAEKISAGNQSIIVHGDVYGSNLASGGAVPAGVPAKKPATRKLPRLSKLTSEPPGDLPPGSYLPFAPNPLFTGRVEDLRNLADTLLTQAKPGTVITQAITGMGGLGKTQLAVEFAYRYAKYFCGVHWLNLADPTTIDSEIALCGGKMGLPNWPDDQPSQVSMTELAWKAEGPRLLILDNFENVAEANKVMPRLRHSNIRLLVTSRRSDWPATTGLSSIPLHLFSEAESLAFLKDSLKDRKDTDEELKQLSAKLGYLPLALELASRYLKAHPRLPITNYLEQAKEAIEHPSMRDWRKDLPAPTQHDLDLQRTFVLSWQAVQDDTAQKMFQIAGYLAPNTPIPLEVFEKGLEIKSEPCDEGLSTLYGFGLLRQSENGLPSVHPLLAEFAQNLDRDAVGLDLALNSVQSCIFNYYSDFFSKPSEIVSNKNDSIALYTHARTLSAAIERKNSTNSGILWFELGFMAYHNGDYQEARSLLEKDLTLSAKIYGFTNHPETRAVRFLLVAVLKKLANYSEAREQLDTVANLWDEETSMPLDSFERSLSAASLSGLYFEMGDYEKAKTVSEQILKECEAVVGPDHPEVALHVNNLGGALQALGDLSGAQAAYERALKIGEAVFGLDHPEVAIYVYNLGRVLQALGDLSGARAAYERALKIDEVVFGPDHPEVAIYVNSLGSVLQALGDLSGAQAAYERALKIDEAVFGPDHPEVAIDVNNLGSVLLALGDLSGARACIERALRILKQFLPPEHPNIKIVQGNLDSLEK